MFVTIPEEGYYLKQEQIAVVEKTYNAKYMGPWCTKNTKGQWNTGPVDVFYQPNLDTEKEYSAYFGIFNRDGVVYITDASSAFSEPITGIICEDGEVIVSRYRHDYVQKGDRMIDGGRNYTRSSLHPTAIVTVINGKFVIEANVME